MKWEQGRRSSNVQDRRRSRAAIAGGGGLITIVAVIAALLLGVDPRALLSATQAPSGGGRPTSPAEDRLADFVSVVLADTEDVWNEQFRLRGRAYREPTMVLFTDAVRSACGTASSAIGPFYCPGDMQVYLDLSFFDELARRHDAPGDFAQAYVVAHEVGHHVQTLLGVSESVRQRSRGLPEAQANDLSVRQELQADCFAGLWAHHAERQRQILEAGDIQEALGAATAIGDDTLQRQAQGYVVPDSFTHGSSAQRVRWFRQGFEQGTLEGCDTFVARSL
ncbi:MAG: neutral zinc metallopeptidase [Sandaracinaceae bacterium]